MYHLHRRTAAYGSSDEHVYLPKAETIDRQIEDIRQTRKRAQ